MNKKRIYVDVHCLQTVPPSCVNRDDTGSPKTCIYGGVTRSRVSSQAWKRAVREEFRNLLPAESRGVRTKKIVEMVKEEILKLKDTLSPEQAEKDGEKALVNAGLKIKSADKGTDALMFMSRRQAAALADLSVNGESDKKKYKAALAANPSVDMALFGRMVASDPSLNYDASAQVAHAISTHNVKNEYDYFTAVDDMSPEDNAGAGHIGVNEYNSGTLYRYATVNVMELYRSLGLETPEAVKAFVEAFVKSMPTGKQNSYANNTLPCAVYVAVREDQPVSMVGAFEKPVPATSNGFEHESETRLEEYAEKTYKQFVKEPFAAFVSGEGLEKLGDSKPFDQVLDELETVVKDLLPTGEE